MSSIKKPKYYERVHQQPESACDDRMCLRTDCANCNPDAKPSPYGEFLLPTNSPKSDGVISWPLIEKAIEIERQARTADEFLAEIDSLPRQQRRRAMRHVGFLGISSEHPAETRRDRRSAATEVIQ